MDNPGAARPQARRLRPVAYATVWQGPATQDKKPLGDPVGALWIGRDPLGDRDRPWEIGSRDVVLEIHALTAGDDRLLSKVPRQAIRVFHDAGQRCWWIANLARDDSRCSVSLTRREPVDSEADSRELPAGLACAVPHDSAWRLSIRNVPESSIHESQSSTEWCSNIDLDLTTVEMTDTGAREMKDGHDTDLDADVGIRPSMAQAAAATYGAYLANRWHQPLTNEQAAAVLAATMSGPEDKAPNAGTLGRRLLRMRDDLQLSGWTPLELRMAHLLRGRRIVRIDGNEVIVAVSEERPTTARYGESPDDGRKPDGFVGYPCEGYQRFPIMVPSNAG